MFKFLLLNTEYTEGTESMRVNESKNIRKQEITQI